MPRKSCGRLKIISFDQINPADRLFAVSLPWVPIDQLNYSVGKTGILSPLHVQRSLDGRFRIVIGFRRYLSCQNLGIQDIPCFIREQKDDLALFVAALEDNLATRELHLLEKAKVLSKLRSEFKLSDDTIMGKFMPLIDIRADRFHFNRYLGIAQLPEILQRSLLDPLEPDIALKLSKWKEQEQVFFLQIISKFQLGKNKQKQLFTVLDELLALEKHVGSSFETRSLKEIWNECRAMDAGRIQSLSISEDYRRTFEALRRLRLPNLAKHEKIYEKLKAALKIPPQINFQAPPYFEGDKIDVGFSFADSDELLKVATKLQDIAKTDELRKILALL